MNEVPAVSSSQVMSCVHQTALFQPNFPYLKQRDALMFSLYENIYYAFESVPTGAVLKAPNVINRSTASFIQAGITQLAGYCTLCLLEGQSSYHAEGSGSFAYIFSATGVNSGRLHLALNMNISIHNTIDS